MCNCKKCTKARGECKPKKCETKCEIEKCCLPRDVIRAEKNLLNLNFVESGFTSGPDFVATFEIILFNETNHKIKNISIIDSLMGLSGLSSTSDVSIGGELRPHYTNVEITGCHPTLVPSFDEIIANGGELLDKRSSYLKPCSVANIRIRIGGNGILLSIDPTTPTNDPTGTTRFKYTSMLQNSAIIHGEVCTSHCDSTPMYPLYIKSGVVTSAVTTVFGFNEEI